MKRLFTLFMCISITYSQFGQIIADHTIVDRFNDIPQYYIEQVKKMLLLVPGQSHSQGYMEGLKLLENMYPVFDVNVTETGGPEGYTTSHLRASRVTWGDFYEWSGWVYGYGEGSWFTNSTAIERTKSGITYCNTNGFEISAIGFGWCWDMIYGTPATTPDPELGVHWYGESGNGPDGNKAWGLDAGDYSQTGNSVSLDTYLNATQEYIDFCKSSGYKTKVFFTTGPVDLYYTGESGYQGSLKHERIREFVRKDTTRILFDFADILCYDDDANQRTATWNGHTYRIITTKNLEPAESFHYSDAGAVRLAKAMWWMLARIAGWNGKSETPPIRTLVITVEGGTPSIDTPNGTLQLNANFVPDDGSDPNVKWSVINETGQASITESGLLSAISNGMVKVVAESVDGTNISSYVSVEIRGQLTKVTDITITGENGKTEINSLNGTLRLVANIIPESATDKSITWSVNNVTGQAQINQSGLLTAIANGKVIVKAASNDGSGVTDTLTVSISGQTVKVTDINITSDLGKPDTVYVNDSIQLFAVITPDNASCLTVTWSVINVTGQALIEEDGLLTAVLPGIVTVVAEANDSSEVVSSLDIILKSNESSSPANSFYATVFQDLILLQIVDQSLIGSSLILYDLYGHMIWNRIITSNSIAINKSLISPGICFAVVYNVKVKKVIKFVVSN
jgi:uncharacterized protein YjdB